MLQPAANQQLDPIVEVLLVFARRGQALREAGQAQQETKSNEAQVPKANDDKGDE